MGFQSLVQKVLTGIQYDADFADDRAIPDTRQSVVRVTTATYTVSAAESGTTFVSTHGIAATNFFLPPVGTSGLWYRFIQTINHNLVVNVASGEVGTMVGYADASNVGLRFITASEKIGGAAMVVSDGTSWLAFVHLANAAHTMSFF